MLKNSSGLRNEIEASKKFHSEGVPLLVSPQLLRARDLGQVDLARLNKTRGEWFLEMAEVKSSDMGFIQMQRFQKQRLFSAQNFLSGLFGLPSRLIHLLGHKDSHH